MPGDVTAPATVSARNIGIRKPRITRARKTLSRRIKGAANTAARPRDRAARIAQATSRLNHRPPRLIGK